MIIRNSVRRSALQKHAVCFKYWSGMPRNSKKFPSLILRTVAGNTDWMWTLIAQKNRVNPRFLHRGVAITIFFTVQDVIRHAGVYRSLPPRLLEKISRRHHSFSLFPNHYRVNQDKLQKRSMSTAKFFIAASSRKYDLRARMVLLSGVFRRGIKWHSLLPKIKQMYLRELCLNYLPRRITQCRDQFCELRSKNCVNLNLYRGKVGNNPLLT